MAPGDEFSNVVIASPIDNVSWHATNFTITVSGVQGGGGGGEG